MDLSETCHKILLFGRRNDLTNNLFRTPSTPEDTLQKWIKRVVETGIEAGRVLLNYSLNT